MPRRAWHLRGRQGRRGRAAGIVTRMCRDAAGGSVARGFCVPRDRARPPEDLSEGGAAPTLVAEHLAPEVEAPINPRRAFDFWPPCRRPFILKSVQVSSPCTLVMRVTQGAWGGRQSLCRIGLARPTTYCAPIGPKYRPSKLRGVRLSRKNSFGPRIRHPCHCGRGRSRRSASSARATKALPINTLPPSRQTRLPPVAATGFSR